MTALLAAIVAGQVAAAAPALAHATPGSPDTPTASAQPMVRAWWPDAGAGATASGLKLVDQHVRTMAGGGFGGMEVAFLSDELPGVPQSATLPPAQRLGQPGVDQNMAQTGTGTCCLDFSNAEAKQVGFGTENWQRIVTQIYRTANSLPGGFVVDLTLSQHWPVAFNNLDPNDLSQHQYARTAYSPITTADVDTGRKTVPVPAQRLWDLDNVPFVFVDHYQAATVVKVASVAANGTPTFGYASLTDVSGRTDQIKNSGTPAGIMDAAWIESHPSAFTGTLTAGSATISGVSSLDGAQRQAGSVLRGPGIAEGTQILSVGTNSIVMDKPATATTTGASVQARWNINTVDADWGPAPARPTSAKVDNAGNRRRMADRQHQYRTTLDKSTLDKLGCTFAAPGAPLAAGNCVLFGTWNQGTGQTRSGGVNTVVPNREYATSIYDKQGTQATIDFWENNILGTWHDGAVTKRLGNTALINLIKANARKFPQASLFEDSLEFSKPSGPGNYWSPGVLAEMSNRLGYDAARYAPVLAGGATFDSTMAAGLQPSDRVTEDWTGVLSDDFTGNHVAALQNWAEKTLDYNFRIQDIGGTGVRHAQLPVGVHETSADSGAAENGRQTQAAAALTGSNWVTAESLTFTRDYTNPWSDVVEGLNNVWAAGVNRAQWHGTPFPVTFNGKNSAWPGWEFQHGSPTGWGAFDSRQTYWGDVEELTGYVSRMQTVLQSGDSKADLAVLRGSDQLASPSRTAYSLPTLLNHGWNYQVIDDRMLKLPSAVVRGKVLAPDGPAYRGIVVSQATRLEVGTVKQPRQPGRPDGADLRTDRGHLHPVHGKPDNAVTPGSFRPRRARGRKRLESPMKLRNSPPC